ncbi:hypothetical protein AB0A98_42240, partial [Streptomyces chrestomyceticus]|uniref:hypothetical protein n=1 Tax=Streptomyces chrestomyceticus TaxID=68185 RepID=UPI0033FD8992
RQRGGQHRDGDALGIAGESLQAALEEVFGQPGQDDVQDRGQAAAGVAVAGPEVVRAADGAPGAFPDAVAGVALVVPGLLRQAGAVLGEMTTAPTDPGALAS